MAGLGLTLELADFKRVLGAPRAVVIALVLQMIVLPGCALLMAHALQLSPRNAVGLLLLAIAPGSVSCSVYSRVFGGNVALNVSLTGLNTLLSLVALPAACTWALGHFGSPAGDVQDLSGKLFESMLVLVIPVAIGMVVRAYAPGLARRLDRPMGLLSIGVLIAFSAAAILSEWGALTHAFTQVGSTAIVFNLLSLFVGYGSAHLLKLGERDAISLAFQLGVRSAILAIFIAMTALNDTQLALPAAVYSITMVPFGLAFGAWVRYRNASRRALSSAQADSADLQL
ncbi:MAG: bile acid:sodium symporter family protein, partial [Rhizobacter sp.]|nr:bile acid:sodium symporter family protein [Rhizobacter sp.]